MHSNVWNLKSSKERLEIIERTQAQKKHLMNILSAKSQIDTRKPQKQSPPIQSHILQKKLIEQNNLGMVKRIVKIGRGRQTPRQDSQSLQTLRNLKTYSSLNRSLRLREIEEENSRMFSRLIMTSPTIKRQHWIKRNIQTSKYKENLLKSKYRNPDYSKEAFRIMQTQPKFTCLKLPKNQSFSRLGISKIL